MRSLKIPKGKSEATNRRADNTMQGRSLLCYSTEAVGLGAFEQFRVYLGPVLLQNSHKNMSQLYTIVHS